MKFAIATEKGQVSRHFGRCPEYTIVITESGTIKDQQTIQNPGLPHGQLPDFFKNLSIDTIISGGMGKPAREKFNGKNITPVLGVTGDVLEVIDQFVHGSLESGESLCAGTGGHHGHDCG